MLLYSIRYQVPYRYRIKLHCSSSSLHRRGGADADSPTRDIMAVRVARVVAEVAEPARPPSAALWDAAAPAVAAALHGRFCSALAAGSLPRDSFGLYIAQDHFFLAAFADAYASAETHIPTAYVESHGPLVAALVAGVQSERDGHAANAARWGVQDIAAVEPMSATTEYCALLAAAATGGSLGVLFAAAAPCMRLYAYLGKQLKAVAAPDTPYMEWIDAYASAEFEELARAAEDLLDTFGGDEFGHALGGEQADAYLGAMRLEVAFFDQVPGVSALSAPPSILCVDFDGTLTTAADSTATLLQAAAAVAPDSDARAAEIAALVSDFAVRKRSHDAASATLTPPEALAARHKFESVSYAPLAHALRGATRAHLSAVGASLELRPGAVRTLGLCRAVGMPVHVITLNPSIDCVRGALGLAGQPGADGTCGGATLHAT